LKGLTGFRGLGYSVLVYIIRCFKNEATNIVIINSVRTSKRTYTLVKPFKSLNLSNLANVLNLPNFSNPSSIFYPAPT
jgi:hypothetical protein